MSEELGLDYNDDIEQRIYLKSVFGLITSFKKDYLKNIKFISTLLDVDKNAGRSEEDAIPLRYVDDEMLKLLTNYINHHKEEDYLVTTDRKMQYEDLLQKWDIDFFKNFLINSESLLDNEDMWISDFLKAVDYLMFDTFKSKLDVTLAYFLHNSFNTDIFSTIQLANNSDSDSSNSDSEEKEDVSY